MPLKSVALLISVATMAALVSGCSQQQFPVTSVYQARQCAEAEHVLRLVSDEQELQRLAPPVLGTAGSAERKANFDDEWVVLAAWGQQPNAGYSVSLTADVAEVDGETLKLPVEFTSPEPGRMQAQVMTSPCLVVSVPKGDYSTIVADELSVNVPAQ